MISVLRDKLNALAKPGGFHGTAQTGPFFEGWYYKLVAADADRALAVIPGLCRAERSEDSHAFVQLYDGRSGRRSYARYPPSAFRPGRVLEVGPNRFSDREIRLDFQAEGRRVEGHIELGPGTPWPINPRHPGFMGWMALLPGVGCYHAVLSLDHALGGWLSLNGEPVSFEGGRGYTEKDWGRRFPDQYLWLQCNHFAGVETAGVSLVASWAQVPWGGRTFIGFVIGLRHPAGFARFATYTGASLELERASSREVRLVARGGPLRLEVTASRPEPSGDPLYLPDGKAMVLGTMQSLDAKVTVRLESGRGASRRTLFEGRGKSAALEVRQVRKL